MAYGRIIQVTIGPPGGTGQTITGLHMSFKVKKALGVGIGGPTAELKIFNMSLQSYFTFVKINYGLSIAVGLPGRVSRGAAELRRDRPAEHRRPVDAFLGGDPLLPALPRRTRHDRLHRGRGAMWNIGERHTPSACSLASPLFTLLANLGSSLQISIRNLGAVPAERGLLQRLLIHRPRT